MTTIVLDPNNAYPLVDRQRLIDAAGILPAWVVDCPEGKPLKQHLDDTYGFGLFEFQGASIDERGQYLPAHPDDDPMHPILKIETDQGVFYQYLHAYVAIPVPGGHFICRMD